ncbi:MAG: hypothetical protein ACJ74O_02675 [Frankiaceae bacterium]
MVQRRPLTDWQQQVLRWVDEGCPGRESEANNRYKTSASALASRGLVRINRRDGWNAVLTEAGRFYFSNGAYVDEPAGPDDLSSQTPVARTTNPPQALGARSDGAADRRSAGDPPPPSRTPTRPGAGRSRRHPAVVYLEQHCDSLGVTPTVRPRALRVLQRAVIAAEARGWAVRPVELNREPTGYRPPYGKRGAHITIAVGEEVFALRLVQEYEQRPHVPTAKERADQAKYTWAHVPRFDAVPTDRLRLELLNTYGGRTRWADGKRLVLEDKLKDVMHDLEQRAAEAVERHRQQRREAEEQQRRWKTAMAAARQEYIEEQRRQIVLDELRRWGEAYAIRRYCAALAATMPDQTAEEWIGWARNYADGIDPLLQPPHGVPLVREPSPSDLVPYLRAASTPTCPHTP